ncbi:MAG: Head fiber protein [Bacillota bacterium]|nr:Head fiber protein [Bacillota bacterium]
MSNVKNYTERGGEKTVIGGELEIATGGKMTFNEVEFSPDDIPDAVTPATYQADSTVTAAAGLVTDFNALLAKLRAAGLMETE